MALRVRIRGDSMAPTFRDGELVAVDRDAYSATTHPIEGDVVLARHPIRRDVRIVKRVAHVVPESGNSRKSSLTVKVERMGGTKAHRYPTMHEMSSLPKSSHLQTPMAVTF